MRWHACCRRESANDVGTRNTGGLRQVGDTDLLLIHGMKIVADPRHGARSDVRLLSLGRKVAMTLEQAPKKFADTGLELQQRLFQLGRHVQRHELAVELLVIDYVAFDAPFAIQLIEMHVLQSAR